MRHKLRADRPAISGNSRRRSADNISTRLAVAFILLRVDNGAANVPVKQDQFAVGRNRSLDLRDPDPLFDALDKAVIELCTSLLHNCLRDAFLPVRPILFRRSDRWHARTVAELFLMTSFVKTNRDLTRKPPSLRLRRDR